ncbi:MAG: alpha/beta fold hydrolase [Rhodoblastus sp.]
MSEPLLLVPGLACTADLWAPQVATLSGRVECRVADHSKGASMAEIAANILVAAPPQFLLAGLSMGGYLAFEIMRQAPQRVRKLALLDTQATPEGEAQRANRLARMEAARSGGMSALADLQWQQLVHPMRHEDAKLKDDVRRMALDTGTDVYLRHCAAIMDRADSRPDLRNIRVPTLVLTGDRDQLTPPEKAREMAEGIAGATLVIVPDCGHMSTMERPEAVNAALLAWLAG